MKIAVIPARGGSKRIPRKNIKEFCGKPMIAYSIECAIGSGLFDDVIVSTDDKEIAAVAKQHGASIPFMRPAELADDYSGTIPVVAHAIDVLRGAGVEPAAVCCIYATAPFVRAEDLRQGLLRLELGSWDYVFSATSVGFPIFRAFKHLPSGGVEMFFPEYLDTRSQNLPEAFHDAGQFYWGRSDAWLNHVKIFGRSSSIVELPRWLVQDIDSPADWERAEIQMRVLKQISCRPCYDNNQGSNRKDPADDATAVRKVFGRLRATDVD